MADESYLSINSESEDQINAEIEINQGDSTDSFSRGVVGLPPNFSESDAEASEVSEERPSNTSSREEGEDEEEQAEENIIDLEEVDDAEEDFRPSEISDYSILEANEYSNENVASMFTSFLTADGLKLKEGYTPDEIDKVIRDIANYDLTAVVKVLIGVDRLHLVKNSGKTELCHVLVKENWLKYENHKFFPIIDVKHKDLISQIVAGAEAEARFKTTKSKKQYASEEEETRAMMTYNMFVHLIQSICNRICRSKVTYQELLDGYKEMLEESCHHDIFKKYKEPLDLLNHPVLNTHWFTHFTGRSALKKFCEMPKFSGIFFDATSPNVMSFGVREPVSLFKKQDFDDTHAAWNGGNDGGKYVTERRITKPKKESAPDPNFKKIDLQIDDDDIFNPHLATSSRSSGSGGHRRVTSPVRERRNFQNFGAFGGPVDDDDDQRSSPPVANNRNDLLDHPNYSDSEISEISDGMYSDESESAIMERETKRKDKEKKKKEREERNSKISENQTSQRNHPNRFDKSTFDHVETTVQKTSETHWTKKPYNDSKETEGNSTETEEVEVEKRVTKTTARRTFASTSSLPVTVVDDSLQSKIMGDQSRRPQIPHESNASQMIKNKEELLEQAKKKSEKKQKELERLEYEKRQMKENAERSMRNHERARRETPENEEARRVFEKQEMYRKEEQERADMELARKLQEELNAESAPAPPRSTTTDRTQKLNKKAWDGSNDDNSFNDYAVPSAISRNPEPPQDHFRGNPRSRCYDGPPPPNYPIHRPQPSMPSRSNHVSPVYPEPCASGNRPGYSYSQNSQPYPPHPTDYSRHSAVDMGYGNSNYPAYQPVYPERNDYPMQAPSGLSSRRWSPEQPPSVPQRPPSNDEIARNRNRILEFMKNMEEDGEVVTDTSFKEKYSYKLPPYFHFHDFVVQHLHRHIEIKTVKVRDFVENCYKLK